jgi:hypothetical protein
VSGYVDFDSGGGMVVVVTTTIPGVPTMGTATAGNASVSVSFTPGSTGGLPVTYTVKIYDFTTSTYTGISASGSSSPINVTGLTNGYADGYYATVYATNSNGSSAESGPSLEFTPSAGSTPSAPLNVTAFADSYTGNLGAAFILFGAPASTGGSPLTGYVGTAYVGGVAYSTTVLNPSTALIASTGMLSCRVDFPNLPAGSYTFSVHATNANGAGAESAFSAATIGGAANTPITVSAVISPFYVLDGNNVSTGKRTGWGNYGGGNFTSTVAVYPGQSVSLALVPGVACDPYYFDPFNIADPSGPFNLWPYQSGHMVLDIYLTTAYVAQYLKVGHRANAQVFGQCTSSGTGVIHDSAQAWTPGAIQTIASTGTQNVNSRANAGNITANTATSITTGIAATFNAGDFYEWSESDIDFFNQQYIPIDPYFAGGAFPGYTPPTNTWVHVAVPISALPNQVSTSKPGCMLNFIQELVVGLSSSSGVAYVANLGYTTT